MTDLFRIVPDVTNLEGRLRYVIRRLDDMRPFWPLLTAAYQRWISRAFKEEGVPATWAPLSPAYATWKAAKYPGRGILVREGDMRSAYLGPTRAASRRSLTLTVMSDVSPYHERGTVKMPRRSVLDALPPPLGKSVEAEIELDRIARRYADEILVSAGLLTRV